MTKRETVFTRRSGFSLLHTEGADFAGKVTRLRYEPGRVYDPREGIEQEMLIPTPGQWG